MQQRNLFLMCRPTRLGKTAWVKDMKCKCVHVSKDEVRNEFLTGADKNRFPYEDKVYMHHVEMDSHNCYPVIEDMEKAKRRM